MDIRDDSSVLTAEVSSLLDLPICSAVDDSSVLVSKAINLRRYKNCRCAHSFYRVENQLHWLLYNIFVVRSNLIKEHG